MSLGGATTCRAETSRSSVGPIARCTKAGYPATALLVARQRGHHASNELRKIFHVPTKKLLGRLLGHLTVVGDQSGGELDVGFRRGHLGRIAEAERTAQALLSD